MTNDFQPPNSVLLGSDIYLDQDMSFDVAHEYFDEKAMINEIYEDVHEVFCEDPTVVAIIRKLEERSQTGMLTYGTTMSANGLPLKEWLKHSLEEKMDDLLYMQRALEELEKNEQR